MIPASSGSPLSSQAARYDRVFSDYRLHIALIALVSIILIFSKLGGTGLANYDDCYYAQKAKEILQTRSWMTMHLNNRPTYDNPPFYMWLVALSYTVFGVSEYAAKFPSALMGVSTIILVYFFARYLFGPWIGFFSSAVLSTTSFFTRYARHAMFDVTLSFFVCLAMFALAGASVAMGQADDRVKAAATFVSRTHDDGGVAHAVDKLLAQGEL